MARGSAKGERRGGRQKGTRNKKTEAQVKAVEESGITPLNFLLEIMRNTKKPFGDRFEAAKAAAPYVHPKLKQVDHAGEVNGLINVTISRDDEDL